MEIGVNPCHPRHPRSVNQSIGSQRLDQRIDLLFRRRFGHTHQDFVLHFWEEAGERQAAYDLFIAKLPQNFLRRLRTTYDEFVEERRAEAESVTVNGLDAL